MIQIYTLHRWEELLQKVAFDVYWPQNSFYVTRIGNSIVGFLIQLLVFCDQKIDLIVKKIESRPMILLKDRRDLFAHGRSLYTGSIRSWSIRSTRVNRSRWSLKKIKDRREQFEFALLAKKLKRGGNCKKNIWIHGLRAICSNNEQIDIVSIF